jgi:excisionase family DNA binding protein
METDAERFLNIKETAKRLNVSERTVFSRIRDGSIQAQKIGKTWRIKAKSLPIQETDTPIEYLKKTISILEKELDIKNNQIEELHILLGAKELPEGRKSKPWWKFWGR